MPKCFLCSENSSVVYKTWDAERDEIVLVCDRCMCGGKFTKYITDKEWPKIVDATMESYAEWEKGMEIGGK